jgi:hypothetical protein
MSFRRTFAGFIHQLTMKNPMLRRIRSLPLIVLFVCAWQPGAPAEPVPVRYPEGTLHGFLELRSQEGRVLAEGDLVQNVRGDRVTARLTFHFKDGSIDDETTVFSQRRFFRLITDHHIQKGPSFPNPIDLSIDTRIREVTVRSTGKDGKEEVKTDHLDLPPDLANGIVTVIVKNIPTAAQETKISMLVATPKVRLVKLAISPHGEEPFSLVDTPRKAQHFEIKIELGGISGMLAPMIGMQPPNVQIWIVGGQAPVFLREEGQTYPDGPPLTIQLVSPVWPNSQRSSN